VVPIADRFITSEFSKRWSGAIRQGNSGDAGSLEQVLEDSLASTTDRAPINDEA
jgi:hypothetical protein